MLKVSPLKLVRRPLLSLSLAVIFGFSLLPIAASGASFTLYDGSLGTFPSDQGFIYLPLAISATQTITTGGVILDTTPDQTGKAGYFGQPASMPTLDRTLGYTVSFSVQVITETHANNNRAGFSLIVLSDDLAGIELGFWEDEIWAQEGGNPPAFTHAEGVNTTTTALTTYHLAILGDAYTLSSGVAPILTGSLRNYSACTSCTPNPYTTPNFLFLGDDTGSAGARIKLTAVSITTNPAPIPLNTVTISGPTSGDAGALYTFTATTSPISATTPVTYTWHAADMTPVTHTNTLSDSISYSWTVTGAKQITVTAYNGVAVVTGAYTITITTNPTGDLSPPIYLPVILKGFP